MASFLSQKFKPGSLGSQGESLAQAHYRKLSYRIIATNLFNSQGKRISEIDFIATISSTIHFVEVKTRRLGHTSRFGTGRDAVDIFKQRKLLRLVYLFLAKHPYYQQFQPQIDVCLVEVSSLDNSQFSVTIIPHAVSDLY
jgi:Holliday junction resolvase-like predicted endonuclease